MMVDIAANGIKGKEKKEFKMGAKMLFAYFIFVKGYSVDNAIEATIEKFPSYEGSEDIFIHWIEEPRRLEEELFHFIKTNRIKVPENYSEGINCER